MSAAKATLVWSRSLARRFLVAALTDFNAGMSDANFMRYLYLYISPLVEGLEIESCDKDDGEKTRFVFFALHVTRGKCALSYSYAYDMKVAWLLQQQT